MPRRISFPYGNAIGTLLALTQRQSNRCFPLCKRPFEYLGEDMKLSFVGTAVAAGLLVMAGQSFAADGKAVYDATCAACHGTGAAGAPKLGDKAAWAPRIATGTAALNGSALKGKGVMPAKGGNSGLADADVIAAVAYMVGQSK
jgi:cytochrome c5